MIVEVIPEKRTSPDKDFFSYSAPRELEPEIKIGSICRISFGKKNIRGIISKILRNDKADFAYELKNIISLDSIFSLPEEYIDIAKWISKYYLCSLGEAISLFLPPDIKKPRTALAKEKTVKIEEVKLTDEQACVFSTLERQLDRADRPAFLHGVTGSGKTEIYIKLAEKVLQRNKQVVVLTPEIILTPQIVKKFEENFPGQICLLHSGLSKSEKYNSYKQFFFSEKRIIIGPRSALLVPSKNIGLIIIDEEQEDAYKQEKDPRYHAVTLAEQIALKNNALLLLGSATPRIETYFRARKGEIDLHELKNRYQKLILPTSEIVDLRNEIKYDNLSPISTKLSSRIHETLSKKRQVILFLNRRGMATFVSCRECGTVIECPNCSIPLVYHVYDSSDILNCHHCDYKAPVPSSCPECGSSKIKFFGAGVDKIEDEIKKQFPKARVRKVDAKSLVNKDEYMKLYDEIIHQKIDILIGTQILAKGLDIPSVDLVGIVSADTGLHLPYYKASEKVFSLITQVSGRSGRSDNVGQTIVQTYWPESRAIQLAGKHDYARFYESEIKERETYNYPPFCHLVRVVSENSNERKAKEDILEISEKLKDADVQFIGPAKCFLSKINRKFRYHIIIKLREFPNPKIERIFKGNPYLTWDVDPNDLL